MDQQSASPATETMKPDVEMTDATTDDPGQPSENGGVGNKANGSSSDAAATALVPHAGSAAAPQAPVDNDDGPPPPAAAVIDSLPYIDVIHPDYEAYALSLIEDEMRKTDPDPDALKYLGHDDLVRGGPRFGGRGGENGKNRLTRGEYDALDARGGAPRPESDAFVPSSCAAAAPPPGPAGASSDDPEAWEASVRDAKVHLEAQRSRLTNLELQSEFEAGLWRDALASVESGPVRRLAEAAEERRKAVDSVNASRQRMQTEGAGESLGRLGRRCEELMTGNRRLADAVGKIEGEVQRMRDEAGLEGTPLGDEGDEATKDEEEYHGVDVMGDDVGP